MMTISLRSVFAYPGRWAAAAVPALAALSFNASAHVPAEGPDHDLLAPFEGTVKHMEKEGGGSCCHMEDGFGNLEEQRYLGEDGGYHYRVLVKVDLKGEPLKGGPRWIYIPDSVVLSNEQVAAVCEKVRKDPDMSQSDKDTCLHPPFNMLWWRPTESQGGAGPYGGPFQGMRTDTIYCYIPRPALR